MIEEKGGSAQILERLMSSYGVNTQKDLAAALDIPANNISGWTQRDSVPGNAIIKCAIDTGADLQWLVYGKLANANYGTSTERPSGQVLYSEVMANGGRPVLRRILDAYGFSMQKQLCELLDISSGTVSTWVRRNYFPGDVVVTCALDTGVSLEWLATGKSKPFRNDSNILSEHSLIRKIPKRKLSAGKLTDDGFYYFDKYFLSNEIIDPVFIESASKSWFVDLGRKNISNGRWVIDIDGDLDVYDIARVPGNKINIVGKSSNFECNVSEVTPLGVVVQTLENNI
ncbi:phage repressor protein CI [Candidatus Pantoea floridensis]|uniref:Bacteriophage CI repressor helix-turn-helix domain-containing protein n=1 Tax=Candidatus Pantoea floridensis TaxID=1938870 RepID=A0A286BYU7_9GAMM|nr:phage repressor protein CI [Pantoea floridensis]PIF21778.1 bacteriophage CI repressor-like protein [Enterobacteriaceae bacterium JKS000233]SOD39288.1 Bacteriophage CI repressor helix-turn-helix domain-containing protein [Pantoea floridensis]